jgi:hypothetical protein
MCEELFGRVVTIYVYADHAFEETLKIADSTSIYALTGLNHFTRPLCHRTGKVSIT